VECKLRSINVRSESDLRRAFRPAFGVTGISDDWYSSTMGVIVIVWEHVGAPERTLGAPGSVTKPTQESQTNSERCLGCDGMQAIAEVLRMYTSHRFPSKANVIHGLLFIITSESY